jgi:hypothetical protein
MAVVPTSLEPLVARPPATAYMVIGPAMSADFIEKTEGAQFVFI